MKLENRVIIVTGGTSGIGLELVKSLSQRNEIIVLGRNASLLKELKEKYSVIPYQVDLSDMAQVEWAASEVLEMHPKVDVLINNAAVQYTPAFTSDDFAYHTISDEITTNFTSICSLTYLLLPALKQAREAAIVNVNSGLALAPKTSSAVYCATKSALNAFSLSLRYQLEGSNIKVMQAMMPLVQTKMTDGRGKGKLTPVSAANALLNGVENGVLDNDIGKVRLLRWLIRLVPSVAFNMMKRA